MIAAASSGKSKAETSKTLLLTGSLVLTTAANW